MHELALASSVIDIVNGYQAQHHFQKVNYIKLSLGALCGVNKESLIFAFKVLSEGTAAEGAELLFTLIPAAVTCWTCKGNFQTLTDISQCPSCSSQDIYLSAGFDELKLLEMDVE